MEEPLDEFAMAAIARTTYQAFRSEIQNAVVGHEQAVARLALLATRHRLGERTLRLLLIGESGIGKTTLLNSFSSAVGINHVLIDAGQLSEPSFAGTDLLDVVATVCSPKTWDPARGAIVIVDELDKLQIRQDDSPVGISHNRARQRGLLSLFGGGDLIPDGFKAPIDTSRLVVVAAGVFDGLKSPFPGTPELHEWGIIWELAERISSGAVIRLDPLSSVQTEIVIKRSLEGIEDTLTSFGYSLQIRPETLRYLATLLAHGGLGGHRGGIGRLHAAIETRLIALLERAPSPGTVLDLNPDDVARASDNSLRERRGP